MKQVAERIIALDDIADGTRDGVPCMVYCRNHAPALARAYLAALRALDCPECEGCGAVHVYGEGSTWVSGREPCPACAADRALAREGEG